MKKVDQSPELVILSSVDDDMRAPKSNNNGSICEVCGKKFGNKKALGVHSRVHLNSLKNPPKMIENDDVPEIGDRKITTMMSCKLCGKRFSSLRSLCGHMRCHPARERQPPEELMKSGGCENRSSSSNETELDEEGYGAACALMLIATGEERYKLSLKDKKEEGNSRKRKRNEVGWKACRCGVCGKSFGSHQALGGHMSSAHTKVFMKTKTASHVSKICDGEFLRGQAALGDHWWVSCSPSLSPLDEGSREEVKRVVLDVDLNELAPEHADGDLPALA